MYVSIINHLSIYIYWSFHLCLSSVFISIIYTYHLYIIYLCLLSIINLSLSSNLYTNHLYLSKSVSIIFAYYIYTYHLYLLFILPSLSIYHLFICHQALSYLHPYIYLSTYLSVCLSIFVLYSLRYFRAFPQSLPSKSSCSPAVLVLTLGDTSDWQLSLLYSLLSHSHLCFIQTIELCPLVLCSHVIHYAAYQSKSRTSKKMWDGSGFHMGYKWILF